MTSTSQIPCSQNWELNVLPQRFFQSGKLGVCVKDREGNVLHQNDACLSLCGNMSHCLCERNCMLSYKFNPEAPDREEGTQYYPNQLIEDEYYDIFFINDGEHLTTFLYPLRDKHGADSRHISGYGLTRREQEIIQLVIQGYTNTEIADELFISKGTLKKHLNNMHKKLPEQVFPR